LVGLFLYLPKKMIKNILAFITGVLIGMIVNMGLIILGSNLIPVSEGFDSMNAINWELTNFIFPFLAHALGTLVGAFLAAKIANSYQLPLAMSIGVFFLIGGVTMVYILPAPVWFICTDLIVAYIPMGYLGWIIAKKV
jgi:uncharacterized membrane protein YqgA involved in biofilm formation